MKKNGFTLVELLAVIAILAILVIIALPNIMSLFNEAKKNSFTNELKNIYKTATSQWMTDSMFETSEKTYARSKNRNCANQLHLSGREELEYYIKMNKNGDVVNYYATDGTYQYSYNGPGVKIEDITDVVQIAKITDPTKILNINCNVSLADIPTIDLNNPSTDPQPNTNPTNTLNGTYYATSDTSIDRGKTIPGNVTFYNTYQEAVAAFGYDVFVKFEIANNVVTDSSIGFIRDGNVYYLRYGSSYDEANKQIVASLIPSEKCDSDYNMCSEGSSTGMTFMTTGNILVAWYGHGCLMGQTDGAVRVVCN